MFRKKDIAFGVIAIFEVLVLVLAASGLLNLLDVRGGLARTRRIPLDGRIL